MNNVLGKIRTLQLLIQYCCSWIGHKIAWICREFFNFLSQKIKIGQIICRSCCPVFHLVKELVRHIPRIKHIGKKTLFRIDRILNNSFKSLEKIAQTVYFFRCPGRHFNKHGGKGVGYFTLCLKHQDMITKIRPAEFFPSQRSRGDHFRIDMMIDMEDTSISQVGKIFFICLRCLQIGRCHCSGSSGNGRTGVIWKNLNDIILVIYGTQITAPLAHHSIYLGVIEDISVILRILLFTKFNDSANQFNRIHMGGAIHKGSLGFLTRGATDNQNLLVRVPFKIMRNIDILTAEMTGCVIRHFGS